MTTYKFKNELDNYKISIKAESKDKAVEVLNGIIKDTPVLIKTKWTIL